jgi:dihydroneopterin aldolase
MRIERSYIFLRDVYFHAFHGVMPQEREVGGDFAVSLRVAVDMESAVRDDIIELTLDYSTLYEVVKREMEQPSMLLEHVAGRIGQAVFSSFPQVTAVDLELTKLNPPMGADSKGAGVELHLVR